MKVFFKNKMVKGITTAINEGINKGGIPKHVRLSRSEAEELLYELRYLRNEIAEGRLEANKVVLSTIDVSTKHLDTLEDTTHPAFLVKMLTGNRVQTLSKQTIDKIIELWEEGEIRFKYVSGLTTNAIIVPLIVEGVSKTP